MAPRGALLLTVLAWPGLAQAGGPFDGCTVAQAGSTTRLDCGSVELIVAESGETDLTARLGAHLAAQDGGDQAALTSQQTALQSSEGLLPAARSELTPRGAASPTESWLAAAAPSPIGSVLVECRAMMNAAGTVERCDSLVRQVAKAGLPKHLRGLVGSDGGDWAAVEAKVGLPMPSQLGCGLQARSSSLVHLCEDGVLAVALIPAPRSGGEVWQRQFLDGVLGGLPADQIVGIEDQVPCQLAGVDTTCTRVHVAHGDGTSFVISAGAQGAQSYYTAICTYPNVGFALPLYCRSLFGDVPPTPPAAEGKSGRRRGSRKEVR